MDILDKQRALGQAQSSNPIPHLAEMVEREVQGLYTLKDLQQDQSDIWTNKIGSVFQNFYLVGLAGLDQKVLNYLQQTLFIWSF